MNSSLVQAPARCVASMTDHSRAAGLAHPSWRALPEQGPPLPAGIKVRLWSCAIPSGTAARSRWPIPADESASCPSRTSRTREVIEIDAARLGVDPEIDLSIACAGCPREVLREDAPPRRAGQAHRRGNRVRGCRSVAVRDGRAGGRGWCGRCVSTCSSRASSVTQAHPATADELWRRGSCQPAARDPRRRRESHRDCQSITSSARNRIDCGTVMPIVFAVFRLTLKSNRAGSWIGRSPGLTPCHRILSTYWAA